MRSEFILIFLAYCYVVSCVNGCPESCVCTRSKRKVVCTRLTSVPSGIPANTQDLIFKGNNLETLQSGDFRNLPNLANLVLSNNKIARIEKGAFRGLGRLRQLNLKGNLLSTLGNGTFDGMGRGLKTINIQENMIATIEDGAFAALKKTNLNLVTMAGNKLTQIGTNSFKGLAKLKTLILSHNRIQNIPAVAIAPLKNLRRFIVEGNRIRDFPYHATFPLLFLLNLSNNSIPELPQNAFQGCPRLTELDLSSNSITKVAPLSNLLHLETLNLEENQLETLPDMSSLIKLKETLLDKNPWKCDCGLQDFRRWIETTETDVICDSPSTLKGTSLKSLEIEDLICATVPPTPQFVNVTQNDAFFCPQGCVCTDSLKHINCNGQKYTSVPYKLPSLASLLDLRRNKIHTLATGTFRPTPNLISLHLQYNGLVRVDSGAFSGLKQLIYLYLSHNKITDLEEDSFAELENLSYLFLDSNRITGLPGGVFAPLSSVYTIYLRHNVITELSAESLQGLSHLRWLYLSYNRIVRLTNDTFSNCKGLQKLDISGNQLTSLPRGILHGLQILSYFDASKNYIDTISNELFQSNPLLATVNMTGNQINTIGQAALENLDNLRVLDLRNNDLSMIVGLPTTITQAEFSGNPWQCTCDIIPLHKWCRIRQMTVSSVVCERPSRLKGIDLADIPITDLDCKRNRPTATAYGSTETSPVTCLMFRNDPNEKRTTTVGKAVANTENRIVDPDGNIVPVNSPGEVQSRGYCVMVGYWNDQEKTDEAIDERGWYHTGDIGTMDEEGYVKVIGRMKDMIIRGGENVYPTEIEDFLHTHPKIDDVQVIGLPDKRLGEEVATWIRLKDGETMTEQEVKDYCKGKISHFKIPKYVKFVTEFPVTVTRKVQKFKMREVHSKELGL